MGVLPSNLGGWTPICNDCGITLCWDISQEEYEEMQTYWDEWKCEECNTEVRGSWLKARIALKEINKMSTETTFTPKENITKEVMKQYERIRQSGKCNMIDLACVQHLANITGQFHIALMTRSDFLYIMKNYSELMKHYGIDRNSRMEQEKEELASADPGFS